MGRKLQFVTFSKFRHKIKFIASLLLMIRKIQFVCETQSQPLNIRLKPFITDTRRFWQCYDHMKIMHFSVKIEILNFPTNGRTWDYTVRNLHLNVLLRANAVSTAEFVEIKEKHRKLARAKECSSHCLSNFEKYIRRFNCLTWSGRSFLFWTTINLLLLNLVFLRCQQHQQAPKKVEPTRID